MPRVDRRKADQLAKSFAQAEAMRKGMIRRIRKDKLQDLRRHEQTWKACADCRLGQCALVQNHVLWRGNIPCDVLFVGEAPWVSEDTTGMPFMGNTGFVMDQIIEMSSIKAYRSEFTLKWCITNAIACMPWPTEGEDFAPRPPRSDELEACAPRLKEFIDLCEPRMVVAVGSVAEKVLKTWDFTSAPTYHIHHPSWIVRQKDQQLEIKRFALYLADLYTKVLP